LEHISYEWEEIHQIRSRAVAVPYFAVTVIVGVIGGDERKH
jgi:hypothetical protein